MRQMCMHLTGRTRHLDMLVHAARVVAKRRPEKADRPVALPSAMAHLTPEKKIAPRNAIRIEPRRLENLLYFTGE